MGREAELLEAARSGNLQLADRILSHRARLSGPLASLRRGPGANVQDSSGYTPLHHAALNGHKDIVQLLLSYEASPNVLDTKGSSPLHLAAWAGHASIVKLLLSHGPNLTNVNLTTRDNESALHCAAQYGHTPVVSMLLQHGADPTVRSVRDETALDLASQYGRLETVELLVRTHPELLEPYRTPRQAFSNTPLHRASRNGHKAVVVVLLKAGHDVNACTAAGTPLHEAALCGKTSVAKALLARGADPRVRDRAGDTVLDALARFPPHVTHDIVALVNQYRLSNGYVDDDAPESPYDNVVLQLQHRQQQHQQQQPPSLWERRVSKTSNTLESSSKKNNTPTSHMLSLASRCFGIGGRGNASTLAYSRNKKKSVVNATTTADEKLGRQSNFYTKRDDDDEINNQKPIVAKRRSPPKKNTNKSLEDILEDSESESTVSISNSLYVDSKSVDALRDSHSVKTLRNWTSAADANYKNSAPVYDEKAFPNLYYASLDFRSLPEKSRERDDDAYEPVDFTDKIKSVDTKINDSVQAKPTPAPRTSLAVDDDDSNCASSHSSSFRIYAVNSDAGSSVCDSWRAGPTESEIDSYDEISMIYSNVVHGNRNVKSENAYLPMDNRDPSYENLDRTRSVAPATIKKLSYHIRGNGECVYDTHFDSIYMINDRSLRESTSSPFVKVARPPQDDPRNICFCDGNNNNDNRSDCDRTTEQQPFLVKSTFRCYCSRDVCELHFSKASERLTVLYSQLTNSVSFPNLSNVNNANDDGRRRLSASAFVLCDGDENSGSDGGHYPYSKSAMDGSYHSEDAYKTREPDQLSISSTTSSTGGPSPRERQRCGTNESSQGIYMSMGSSSSGYHAHSPGSNTKVSPTPPKKPPRRNLSVSPTHLLPPGGIPDVDRSHHLVRTGQTRSQDDLDDLGPNTKHSGLRHGRSVDQYVESSKVSPRTKPVPHPRPSLALLASRRDQPVAISTMYENVVIKEQNPRRKLRRNQNQYENYQPDDRTTRSGNQKYCHSSQERSSLESLLDDVGGGGGGGGTPSDGECRSSSAQQTPLSPTHYNQPPTPDHPPPSAKQAEMSIHERIRPLSQEYKRMSRDMETETDPRFLARSSSPASSASTDHCVEEYVTEVPFAGLFKGSTTTLDGVGVRPVPAERPKSLRKLKTVYDNGSVIIRNKDVQPATRIDPDVNPWQYRHAEDKEPISNPSSVTSIDKPLSLLSPFDEQEEWAKINEIMASFGSRLVRESVFAEELEQEFKSRLGARFSSESSLSPCVPAGPSILSWLTSLGLQHLESNFVNNGFDHLDFINGVIEDNDLAEMAIEEPEKSKVLESCKSLPTKIDEVMSVAPNNNHNNNVSSSNISSINNNINNNSSSNSSDKESEQDPEAVNKWLTSIGLECYQDTFRRHLYTDMERVRRIWEVELTAVLEIQKVGHRRRILASVAGRQNGPINNMEDIKADLNTLERNIQTLKAEIKEKLPDTPKNTNNHAPPPPPTTNLAPGGETLKRSHKKNRPPPPPPARTDLEIRAPSALLVGVPGALCTQWRHQPLVLVTGSVMYVANYLGSTIVKELRGKESTQKSIQKLKKSNNEPRALPDIILSISYRGVKFLNTITRDLICEHEIRNIHCACQDADDLTHFAYITKDVSKTHYCHVFCVATMDQATEVILTLGQAFEVAYQMALRDSAMKSNTNTLQLPHHHNQQQQQSQVRSQSSNQIAQQAKTPTHEQQKPTNNNNPKDRPNPVHGRSHSVTEIKLNGHQLKVAPISVSISNEDFQAVARNGEVQKSPRTPSGKAPIALAEEL